MFRLLVVSSVITSAIAIFTVSLPSADGCITVRPKGAPSISIAEESAIIVWDPVKKVQHFIRRAAFDTKSPDFGFLVPTPTMPELPLKEVEDGIFSTMDTWLRPRIVEQMKLNIAPMTISMVGCSSVKSKQFAMGDVAKSSVRVLHEQKVGGYDVNVLEADDAEALAKWIKDHGYSADPDLYEWLTPYTNGKWKISAFKISQDPKGGVMTRTKAVRMTFSTDRPYFPYREPEVKRPKQDDESKPHKDDSSNHGSRLLRVLFVCDARYEGQLGNRAWGADVPWSDTLTEAQREDLIRETGVPESSVPATAWLTTFEDRASPRPGREEVFFEPSSERTPVRPPDIIRYNDVWIPVDCSLVGLLFIGVTGSAIVRRWRSVAAPKV